MDFLKSEDFLIVCLREFEGPATAFSRPEGEWDKGCAKIVCRVIYTFYTGKHFKYSKMQESQNSLILRKVSQFQSYNVITRE